MIAWTQERRFGPGPSRRAVVGCGGLVSTGQHVVVRLGSCVSGARGVSDPARLVEAVEEPVLAIA